MTEVQTVALLQALGRPRQRPPAALTAALDQRDGNVRLQLAAAADAIESGGNDARIVEDERIARAQKPGQLAHDPVLERHSRPHHEQASGIARARGMQRDALLRQCEIEEVRAHQEMRIRSAPTSSRTAPVTLPNEISRTAMLKAPTWSRSMPASN